MHLFLLHMFCYVSFTHFVEKGSTKKINLWQFLLLGRSTCKLQWIALQICRNIGRNSISCLSISSCLSVEKRLKETVQFGVEGSSAFLECQPRSPQATVKWFCQKDGKRKAVRFQINTHKQLCEDFQSWKASATVCLWLLTDCTCTDTAQDRS